MKTRLPHHKTKPIPVRLSNEVIARLDHAAGALAGCRAGVIRLAIHQLLPELEAGRLRLTSPLAKE